MYFVSRRAQRFAPAADPDRGPPPARLHQRGCSSKSRPTTSPLPLDLRRPRRMLVARALRPGTVCAPGIRHSATRFSSKRPPSPSPCRIDRRHQVRNLVRQALVRACGSRRPISNRRKVSRCLAFSVMFFQIPGSSDVRIRSWSRRDRIRHAHVVRRIEAERARRFLAHERIVVDLGEALCRRTGRARRAGTRARGFAGRHRGRHQRRAAA